jgi:hypothetical protein
VFVYIVSFYYVYTSIYTVVFKCGRINVQNS